MDLTKESKLDHERNNIVHYSGNNYNHRGIATAI